MKYWSNQVISEFFLQGDAEKLQGLPVSAFMDRERSNAIKCQQVPFTQCDFLSF